MSFSGEKTKKIYGAVFGVALHLKQVTSCSMHSIVMTFREAVIKVEVANFGAAIDTLIDQDANTSAMGRICKAMKHITWPPLLKLTT